MELVGLRGEVDNLLRFLNKIPQEIIEQVEQEERERERKRRRLQDMEEER